MLSIQTTNKDLEDMFGEAAPLRRAFVVPGPDGACKGIGFVQYAMKEDAEEAIATLNVTHRTAPLALWHGRATLSDDCHGGLLCCCVDSSTGH